MIQGLRQRLGKGLTALAVLLVTLLVVQAPVAIVDRALHASGHAHAANAFAGALETAVVDHDHHHDDEHQAGGDHHDDDEAGPMDQVSNDDSRDPASPQNTHHHHDGPSVYGLAAALTFAGSWAAAAQPPPPDGPHLASAGTSPQERPPKALLEHVA